MKSKIFLSIILIFIFSCVPNNSPTPEKQKTSIKAKNTNPSSNNATQTVIESVIDGDFEGFEGETIIILMNGQIWQQIDYQYMYMYAFMPKVLIYNTNYGYKMKVDGLPMPVSVIRLK